MRAYAELPLGQCRQHNVRICTPWQNRWWVYKACHFGRRKPMFLQIKKGQPAELPFLALSFFAFFQRGMGRSPMFKNGPLPYLCSYGI